MISVIIPVVNESDTVGGLVASAQAHPEVEEVIVVDDGSVDGTPELARQAGARVLTSSFLGKGASLKDGLRASKEKILVFLDAHLKEVPPEVISRLAAPIQEGKVDLAKATCPGSLEPVCVMTARPLLRTFFPELNHIDYPLSGLWAARRSLLQKFTFEVDHGVEIGLLIDAQAAGARIQQISVPRLFVKDESPDLLEIVAQQVLRAILTRAADQNRFKAKYVARAMDSGSQAQTDLRRLLEHAEPADRLALFDMDGVLVRGSFILELAYQLEKGTELANILDNVDLEEDDRTRKIAALFTGVARATFEKVAHDMALMPGARETVAALRKAGYLVGIVSDGFHVAAEIVRCRVFGDFSIANSMKFHRGKATGKITFSPALSRSDGCPEHPHCKANIILNLVDMLDLPPENILAVGNSENDVCMLEAAGHSAAFRPNRSAVRTAAEHVVEGALSDLLHVLKGRTAALAR